MRGHHIIALAALLLTALALRAASPGDDPLELNKRGAELLYKGDYEKALAAFEQSRRIHHDRGERELEAIRFVNISAIHFYQGRYLKAWETQNEAAALVRAGDAWAADVRELIDVNRAALLQKLGRDHDALDIYNRVRRAARSLSGAEKAQTLSNLGALYRRLGDPYRAIECEREALGEFRGLHDVDGELGAAKNIAIAQALDFGNFAEARAGFQHALALAARAGNRREVLQARLYLGEAQFRAGDAANAEQEWSAALAQARELQAPEEEWKALFGLGRVRGDRALIEQAASMIEASRASLGRSPLRSGFLADKRDVYDALIGAASTDDEWLSWLERSRGHGPVRAAELRARLPEGSALMVFWMGARGGQLRWFTRRGRGAAAVGRARKDARWLAAAPSELRWIVVPDGPLAGVAFDALRLPDGALVVERHETWLLPHLATVGAPPRDAPAQRWPWKRQLLGIGDPKTGLLLPGDEKWVRLPRASQELAEAAQHLDGRSDLLEREAARKGALAGARGYLVVHLATHAAADFENPARSRILFAGPEYLYLKEIAELDLAGVELVTLSACETAAGAAARGDAPMSLSRAFLDAGAGATVGTLWAVRDEAALTFTGLLYRALSGGKSKAEAVRSAKLAMLKRGAPEEDWAAFVLTGDGQTPLTPYVSWARLLSAVAAVLVLGALTFTALQRRRGGRRRTSALR